MDLLFGPEPATTTAPIKYGSMLGDGMSVQYQNAHGIASVVARDFHLALFFIMTAYKGRPSYPKALFHCDFEDGWCDGFRPSKDSDIPWNLWKGRTPSNKTGPVYDHTRSNKDGTYLYMEGSNARLGDTAIFTTPPVMMLEKPHYCLRFWYNMHGAGQGSLWVYWNAAGEENLHTVVDMHAGQKSKTSEEWRESLTTLEATSRTKHYRPVIFEFRAIRGFTYTSDIAVDDVLLMPGKCRNIYFSKTATTMTFRAIATTIGPPTTTTLSWKATDPSYAPCGEADYFHTTEERCCAGTVRKIKSTYQQCCGSRVYNIIHQQCCGGVSIWVNLQGCCFGRIVYVKRKRSCCDNKATYDIATEQCVKGKIKKLQSKKRGKRYVGETPLARYPYY